VAVIGASRDRGSIGYALLHNLVRGGFEGAIYPVNPKYEAIGGLRCYPRARDIEGPVDLALVLVPAR